MDQMNQDLQSNSQNSNPSNFQPPDFQSTNLQPPNPKSPKKKQIKKELLHNNSHWGLITGGLVMLIGVLTTLDLLEGSIPFLLFLGAMFTISSVIKGIITIKIFYKNYITIFKVIVEGLLGLFFIAAAGLNFSTTMALFIVYFSTSIFSNVTLSIDLNPLKGWGVSALIAFLKTIGVLFFIIKGVDYGVNHTLTSTIGFYFILDGAFFLYLGAMARLKEYLERERVNDGKSERNLEEEELRDSF